MAPQANLVEIHVVGSDIPCCGGVLVAISCIFERRRARFSYFHKSDDDGLKIRKPGMPGFLGISPRQTTKAHVLYVPGVNLQLITQERDHKDPSQITAPHMTFGRTVCKTAVIFCQVNALFIAQLSCHVFDSAVCACTHARIATATAWPASRLRLGRGYNLPKVLSDRLVL